MATSTSAEILRRDAFEVRVVELVEFQGDRRSPRSVARRSIMRPIFP